MNQNRKPMPTGTPFNWGNLIGIGLLWLLIFYFMQGRFPQSQEKNLSYTQFKEDVRKELVSEVTMQGDEVIGQFKVKSPPKAKTGQPTETGKEEKSRVFKTILPPVQDPELLPLLEKYNVTIQGKSETQPWFLTLIINLLPWVLIIGFFFFFSKKLRERMGGDGGLFSFSKSKAKLYEKTTTSITFDDVAGLDNAKKELQEIVEYLKNPEKFRALGGELPRGLLLVGPPGVGKTLMAQGTAGEADVPFFSLSGSEFIEMFVGVGASRVRDLFEKAKKDAPAIIFIDEIDSIGRVRGTGLGGGHDEREQTLNQILAEMDGFSPHASVVVMAATNRPDVLDPALIRPGRFDRRITLDLPHRKARLAILKIHTRHVPLSENVDLENTAERTPGLSGADLKNLVNEAALVAARKDKKQVEAEDFDQARDKVLMGIEREDVIKGPERRVIAYHESGHALLARELPGADPLAKVTIIPRGQSLGATEQIPEEDRHNFKRSYLLDRITILLGGRAAEKIVFDDISTGAGDDLKKATQLARRMVCQWGMSEKIGPVTFRSGETHPFLGRELTEVKDFSEHTAQLIDEEIHKIVRNMEKKAEDKLTEIRKQLDTLAEELLQHETLTNDDIEKILGKPEEPAITG